MPIFKDKERLLIHLQDLINMEVLSLDESSLYKSGTTSMPDPHRF
jgi:hypothetical protein